MRFLYLPNFLAGEYPSDFTARTKINAIEYFTGLGATCSCITHRVGNTEVAKAGWTIYGARLDIAAMKRILQRYPTGTKVYVVAHCADSICLLAGTIPASQIHGITASNVFMNPKFALMNKF